MVVKWYIVYVYFNFEKKVVEVICVEVVIQGFEDKFEEVFVLIEEVVEVCKGCKVNVECKYFLGYVLVKMDMIDQVYYLVMLMLKVMGFLGLGKKLILVFENEVKCIFGQMEEDVECLCLMVSYEVGEMVNVIDGYFQSFIGVVEEVDDVDGCLKVVINIFGWVILVELEYVQVEKMVQV